MKERFLLGASLALIFTIVVGMLAITHKYHERTEAISFSQDQAGSLIGDAHLKEVVTRISITYLQKIAVSSSERVTAEVNQTEIRTRPTTSQTFETPLLQRLQLPVRMSLQSPAFDFGNDDGVRYLPRTTKTPITLTWAPVPRQAGRVALNLRLKDVYNVRGTINGENKLFNDNDDIPLTVDVRTAYWLTPFLQSWALWLAAAMGFIVSSYLSWKGIKERPSKPVRKDAAGAR